MISPKEKYMFPYITFNEMRREVHPKSVGDITAKLFANIIFKSLAISIIYIVINYWYRAFGVYVLKSSEPEDII